MEKVINKKNDPKRKVRIKLKKITKQIRWKTKKWVKNENIINKRKNAINKKFSLWKNKINFSIESRILMQDFCKNFSLWKNKNQFFYWIKNLDARFIYIYIFPNFTCTLRKCPL